MRANTPNGFSIGKLDGLTWDQIDGYSAEVDREHGDVYYRDKFLCTSYNDETGGDVVDACGATMADEDLQTAIDAIDEARASERFKVVNDRYGGDMTPTTFSDLKRQVKNVFAGTVAIRREIRNGEPVIVDGAGEIVARLAK